MDLEKEAENKGEGNRSNDGTDTDSQHGNEMAKHQEGTSTRDTDTDKKFDSIEDAEKDLLNTDTDNESTESIAEEIQASILDTDSQVDSQVDSQNEDRDQSEKTKRLSRKCKAQWTPGTYADIHKGTTTKHKSAKNSKSKEEQLKTQGKVIMQLHHENQQLKDKIANNREDVTEEPENQNANQKKIQELEAEIDCLHAQIKEFDEGDKEKRTKNEETDDYRTKIQQLEAQDEELKTEIENLQERNDNLEEENNNLKAQLYTLTKENEKNQEKLKESEKKAKKLAKAEQKIKDEKKTVQDTLQEKSRQVVALQGQLDRANVEIERLKHQRRQDAARTWLLGDSNCRDIHPQLSKHLQTNVKHQWAATLSEAKTWVEENEEEIEGGTVVLLAGTNDLKQNRTRQEVNTMHKETTQTITDKGARLIIVQLPPVYYPQLRAEQRNRDTEILNEILSERHGKAIAKTDPITIHRTQMKPDGLHLTLESANTMAKEIAKTIRENKEDQESEEEITNPPEEEDPQSTEDDLNTQLITTTKNIAAKLIGRGGERINKIKNLHNVNITSEQPPDHEHERRFTVTGTQEDTTQAIKLMKKIIEDTVKQDQEHQRRQEYTNAPPSTTSKFPVQCRYYSRGQCTKGKGCRFLHQKNVPADLSEHSEADSTPEETTRTITIQPKQTNRNRQDEPKPHQSKDTRRHTTPPREERTKKRKERNTTPPQQRRSRSPTKKSRKQEERNSSPSPSTSHRTKHYERNSSPYKKSRSNKPRDYSPTPSTSYRPTRKSSTTSHRPKSHNQTRSSSRRPTPKTSRSHKKDRSRSRSRRNQTPTDTRSRTHRTRTPSPEHRRRRRSTTPDRHTWERQDRYRSNRWEEDEELQSALWTILSRTKRQ